MKKDMILIFGGASLIPILVILVSSFIFSKTETIVLGEELEMVTTESKEVADIEVERVPVKFLWKTFNEDSVRLFFIDGTAEIIDEPSELKVRKGKNNLFLQSESRYEKSDKIANVELVLELDEEKFEKFTRQYVSTFNKTPAEK